MTRSFVHVVCSPRPRVGKTLVARLLAEYFLNGDRLFSGFDTDSNEPEFADRFPNDVTVNDIRAIQGQIGLFDRLLLNDDVPKIVDVWHRVYDRFFHLVDAIGFVEEARQRGIEPLFYVVDDGDPLSFQAHRLLGEHPLHLSLINVKNDGAAGTIAATGPRFDTTGAFPSEPVLTIPPLDPILRRVIDAPDFSVLAYLRAPTREMSLVVRAAIRAWAARIFVQLQNFELRQSLADAEYLR